MKKKMTLMLLAVFLCGQVVRAEGYHYQLTKEQEHGANLILLGAALTLGGIVAGKQAHDIHKADYARKQQGLPPKNPQKTKDAGKYAGAAALGLASGILALGVGISVRFGGSQE